MNSITIDKETFSAMLRLLNHSFDEIDYNFKGLTNSEKNLISEKDFNSICVQICRMERNTALDEGL